MYSKLFNKKQLHFIYTEALSYSQQIKQGLELQNLALAFKYECKLEALVEILEFVYVFNQGDGLDGFNGNGKKKTVQERLDTFKREFK